MAETGHIRESAREIISQLKEIKKELRQIKGILANIRDEEKSRFKEADKEV